MGHGADGVISLGDESPATFLTPHNRLFSRSAVGNSRRKHYAKIRGYMTLFCTGGSVLGPVIAGAVLDRWQCYEPLLWALVFSYIVAGIFYASLSKPWRRAANRR